MLPMDPPSAAAEVAGNSTPLRLLLSHLHQKGLIEPALLIAMIEQTERNTWQGTPRRGSKPGYTWSLAKPG